MVAAIDWSTRLLYAVTLVKAVGRMKKKKAQECLAATSVYTQYRFHM